MTLHLLRESVRIDGFGPTVAPDLFTERNMYS